MKGPGQWHLKTATRLHHLLGHSPEHPQPTGQRQQRCHQNGLEEAAQYVVHQTQAHRRFKLGDRGPQEEVRKHHATDPYADGQIDHRTVLSS